MREAALARVRVLETRLADLERRLPAHSIPPTLVFELEDLEDQLTAARQECLTLGDHQPDPAQAVEKRSPCLQ
jgi:hypothetical protein